MVDILTSLNAGSGIDVKTLTDQLVSAEIDPRQAVIDQRMQSVDAKISALGQFQQALGAMVSALDSRISSGALSGQPTLSDSSVFSLSVDPGTVIDRRLVEVRQLAQGQTLASAPVADSTAPFGEGNITIHFGRVSGEEAGDFTEATLPALSIDIDSSNNSLAGIRDAINDAAARAGAPIQAQLINDGDGTRLMLRGQMGENSGFVIETSGDSALEALRFGEGATGGMERTQSASDSIVALDGLEVRRSSNVITDLIPGARLALARAAPGAPVAIEAQRDPANLSQSVNDVAAALNELAGLGQDLSKSVPGSAGALAADGATRRALQGLTGITSISLIPAAGDQPTRLADIGLSIDRYGKFTVDSTRLSKAVAQYPERVEAMLTALNAKAKPGVSAGPLRQISDTFTVVANGTPGQPNALQLSKQELAKQQQQLNDRADQLRQNYTKQFTALDIAVGKSKAMQAYLDQQIALWTKSDK